MNSSGESAAREQWMIDAARDVAAEIHFQIFSGGNMDSVVSANHPENAKFLDRRAKELAPIIARHYAAREREVRPRIVCLCGSTRFRDTFIQAYADETDAGRIVLSVGRLVPQAETVLGVEKKAALDELHKRKIDLADEVLVLDVDGYIGSSTRSEIDYAVAHNKPIRYLSAAGGTRRTA